jgi:PhnB protein
MKAITTYLTFDGNTREAMTFYAKCLGATLHLQSFKDAKVDVPKGHEHRIMHARLERGSAVLMASDAPPGQFTQGNNFFVCVDCESTPESEQLFKVLGEGGKVMMPLQDTFWGAWFGMLTDRFGVQWMFNYEHPKKG